MLINLKQPDASGHANKWEAYRQGIRDGDAFAGALWKLLRDEAPFAGETALFITNDHGRHLDGHHDGFVSHGDDCAGCRKIQLLALGPQFRRGAVVERHANQLDVAVTAAAILGLAIPGSNGRVLDELRDQPR
jgi:phosphopentomutase